MRKIIVLLIAMFAMISPAYVLADDEVIPVQLTPTGQSGKPQEDKHTTPHRTPTRIIGFVDFSSGTVSLSNDDEVLSFEIWSLDTNVILSSFDDEASFVQQLSEMEEATIVLQTENYTYRGYFTK